MNAFLVEIRSANSLNAISQQPCDRVGVVSSDIMTNDLYSDHVFSRLF